MKKFVNVFAAFLKLILNSVSPAYPPVASLFAVGSFVASATVIAAVPSKFTPLIARAVVNLGAETIVMTGVVVEVATVASLFAEVTEETGPVGHVAQVDQVAQVAPVAHVAPVSHLSPLSPLRSLFRAFFVEPLEPSTYGM